MELQEHAMNVMKTVDEAIREMDNLDGFFEYLHQIGSSHRKIPGFNSDYFWVRVSLIKNLLFTLFAVAVQLNAINIAN